MSCWWPCTFSSEIRSRCWSRVQTALLARWGVHAGHCTALSYSDDLLTSYSLNTILLLNLLSWLFCREACGLILHWKVLKALVRQDLQLRPEAKHSALYADSPVHLNWSHKRFKHQMDPYVLQVISAMEMSTSPFHPMRKYQNALHELFHLILEMFNLCSRIHRYLLYGNL